jgi:hypothetical protein
MDQCFYIRVSRQSQSINPIINIEMRSYNSGNSGNSRNSITRNTSATSYANATPFCKVCCDAGLPADKYNSHYVKDQPGPNGKVVCPTLLSQRCLICGVPGHTTRYCPENPDNSSTTTSSSSTVSVQIPRYALATDEVRLPPVPVPVQPRVQRAIPRIVYQTIEKRDSKTEFPALPGKFNLDTRFHNDEPLHKRGPASPVQASPVHSPAEQKFTRVKYNKRNNPFGALQNYQVDSEDEEPKQQQQQQHQQKPQQLPPISASSLSSWASVAATTKTTATTVTTTTTTKQQQQRSRSRFSIVVPTAISAPPLPPIAFKAKPTTKSAAPTDSKQVKKLWGDTDSEDDEEFLQRGLAQ